MLQNFENIEARFAEIERQMADPVVCKDRRRMESLGRAHAELAPVVRVIREHQKIEKQLQELKEMEGDPEVAELVQEEKPRLERRFQDLEAEIRELLIPKDPDDERNAIVEIRAGTGGEEAALFAGDLMRMYTRYIEERGWNLEMLSSNPTELGGFKEVAFLVRGNGAYGLLRFEGGVHRVQRVPQTEAAGRIHTSAVTVAVLPEVSDVEVEISREDLRIDVCRSSGPGGQSVNTTDSAVRITHLPTGLVVTCQDEKSQHKNRAKALKVLQARLFKRQQAEAHAERDSLRRTHVKSGDRSDRARTYNFPQSRVTDHRVNYTSHNLPAFMEGEIGELIDALWRAERVRRMEEASEVAAESPEGSEAKS